MSLQGPAQVRPPRKKYAWWETRDSASSVDPVPLELTDDEHLVCFRVGRRVNVGEFRIPSLPGVAAETLDLLRRADPEVSKVSKLIHKDQQLAADVISFANSALFAGVMNVTNIPQAVTRVGLQRTRSLVMASCVRRLIFGTDDLARAKELWRHSMGCAAIASCIATNWRCPGDDSYLAGLFHDVGKSIVLSLVNSAMQKPKPVPRRPEFVDHVIDIFHEGVGVSVSREWNLPEHVVNTIRRHTENDKVRFTKPQAIIAIANNCCHRLGVGASNDGRPIARPTTLQAIGATPEDLFTLLDGVPDVIDVA